MAKWEPTASSGEEHRGPQTGPVAEGQPSRPARPRAAYSNTLVSYEELRDFESRVRDALRREDESALDILGYGEVSTVLGLDTAAGRLACKRMPPMRDREEAEETAALIAEYVHELRQHGLNVIETGLSIIEADDGTFVVYVVQPGLPAGSLGPDYFRGLDTARATEEFGKILSLLEGSVTPTVAPDGQLSNWAFVGDDIFYLDLSSPFMRDEDGNERLDWYRQLAVFPFPLRLFVCRYLLPDILDKYHSLRGQIVDFMGNLQKERLDHLSQLLLFMANEHFAFDPPITMENVREYYLADARTHATVQTLRRAHRWFWRRVLRRTYPHFLAPKIERNL